MKPLLMEEKMFDADSKLFSAVGYMLGYIRCHNKVTLVYGNTGTGKSALVRMLAGICRDSKTDHGEPAEPLRFGDTMKGGSEWETRS